MEMRESGDARAELAVGAVMGPGMHEFMPAPHCLYVLECRGPDGALKWREEIPNVVTTGGKDDLLDKYFAGSAYTAAWYMGLLNGTPAATDTLASHTGWTEQTPYTGNRPAITWSSASGGSKAGSAVSYSITASATVSGAFLASVNTGTAGILYSAGNFSSSRTVASGDTLNVTPTMSV
ncbi:MAG: hypothetical protein KGL35_30470 [Bradyrhizobium sp.]|nr:hypothetical protein [Bradyrhizobium sp.]